MTAARYEIVHAPTYGQLQYAVEQYLQAGWLPTGGVTQISSTYETGWYQAIYRVAE